MHTLTTRTGTDPDLGPIIYYACSPSTGRRVREKGVLKHPQEFTVKLEGSVVSAKREGASSCFTKFTSVMTLLVIRCDLICK